MRCGCRSRLGRRGGLACRVGLSRSKLGAGGCSDQHAGLHQLRILLSELQRVNAFRAGFLRVLVVALQQVRPQRAARVDRFVVAQHLGLSPRVAQRFVSDFGILGNVDGDEARARFAADSVERGAVRLDVGFRERKQVRFPGATPREIARLIVVFFERFFPRSETDFRIGRW